MPIIANVRKAFNFQIEMEGIVQAYIQEFVPPRKTVEVVEHGSSNSVVKTAGRATYEEMTLTKLRSADNSDTTLWTWLNQVQNVTTQTGANYQDYARIIVIRELSPTGAILNSWRIECWCSGVDIGTLNRGASENTIESATFQVNDCQLF